MAVASFRDLRAWQESRRFKNEIYRLLTTPKFIGDVKLSGQLREAAASVPSCIAEGFGRFDPLDNARLVRIGRASLLECQNHVDDALDRGYIDRTAHAELEDSAGRAMKEIVGYLDYLQSSEAKRNAERIKRQRSQRAERDQRREPRTMNHEPTKNSEP